MMKMKRRKVQCMMKGMKIWNKPLLDFQDTVTLMIFCCCLLISSISILLIQSYLEIVFHCSIILTIMKIHLILPVLQMLIQVVVRQSLHILFFKIHVKWLLMLVVVSTTVQADNAGCSGITLSPHAPTPLPPPSYRDCWVQAIVMFFS